MKFGSWDGREGINRSDPWSRSDKIENMTTMDLRDNERELSGARIVRKQPKPPKPKRSKATIFAIIIIVISLFLPAITTMISHAVREPVPDIPDGNNPYAGMDPFENYDDFRDFFEEYYGGGTSSGVNSLERIDPDPSVALNLTKEHGKDLTLQEVYAKCSPSIVAITAQIDGMGYGWGTGIILTESGYIITNSHVLDDATSASVTLYDDREYPAMLVGYDPFSDIAVIKIDCTGLTPAQFGDSSDLEVGDDVVAIGNPLGEELRGTMTNGIVSAINRKVYTDGNYMTLIQTNAAINGGNSGGALIDMSGRVIGVTNMKIISYDSSIEGLGFAIPTSSIKPVVDEILDNGYVAGRPGIGVTVGSIPPEVQKEYGLPDGLYVSEVTSGSGADLAGIIAGDVIIAADGIDLYTTADLNAVKGDRAIGESIVLTVWRDGKTSDYDVEIMDMNKLFY